MAESKVMIDDGIDIQMVLIQPMVENTLIMNDIILTRMVGCRLVGFYIMVNDIDYIRNILTVTQKEQWLILMSLRKAIIFMSFSMMEFCYKIIQ
jgi:hypothetical protein